MGNHHILDLEKIIHSIVNKRSEKIISLNNIRRQTEKKIKEMSFDIDRYEQDIRDGKVPSPQNDNYAYMRANGQKISLKDLRYRNEKNTERFNSLICHIINHFIQQKKLLCMIKKGEPFNNLFTTPEIIKDRKIAKEIGFTTTDVLPYISHDTKFEDYDLGIYGTPVTRCPMAEL
ncbi:MAG: hypothetical protein LBP53_00735 [Candidatus Peribacteria bacterium]|nr:hypothetical protein [Candidatus Peribacteria bacterium]